MVKPGHRHANPNAAGLLGIVRRAQQTLQTKQKREADLWQPGGTGTRNPTTPYVKPLLGVRLRNHFWNLGETGGPGKPSKKWEAKIVLLETSPGPPGPPISPKTINVRPVYVKIKACFSQVQDKRPDTDVSRATEYQNFAEAVRPQQQTPSPLTSARRSRCARGCSDPHRSRILVLVCMRCSAGHPTLTSSLWLPCRR